VNYKKQTITSIGLFYNNVGFYLEGVWLWRICGIYSLTPFTNFPMMFTSLLYSVMVRSSSPFSYLSNHPFIFLKTEHLDSWTFHSFFSGFMYQIRCFPSE